MTGSPAALAAQLARLMRASELPMRHASRAEAAEINRRLESFGIERTIQPGHLIIDFNEHWRRIMSHTDQAQPTGLSIGEAIANLRDGNKVRRRAWPGTAYLVMKLGDEPNTIWHQHPGSADTRYRWAIDQGDILATDWTVVD